MKNTHKFLAFCLLSSPLLAMEQSLQQRNVQDLTDFQRSGLRTFTPAELRMLRSAEQTPVVRPTFFQYDPYTGRKFTPDEQRLLAEAEETQLIVRPPYFKQIVPAEKLSRIYSELGSLHEQYRSNPLAWSFINYFDALKRSAAAIFQEIDETIASENRSPNINQLITKITSAIESIRQRVVAAYFQSAKTLTNDVENYIKALKNSDKNNTEQQAQLANVRKNLKKRSRNLEGLRGHLVDEDYFDDALTKESYKALFMADIFEREWMTTVNNLLNFLLNPENRAAFQLDASNYELLSDLARNYRFAVVGRNEMKALLKPIKQKIDFIFWAIPGHRDLFEKVNALYSDIQNPNYAQIVARLDRAKLLSEIQRFKNIAQLAYEIRAAHPAIIKAQEQKIAAIEDRVKFN